MKWSFLVIALFQILTTQVGAQAKDANTITWMRWDDPPIFVMSGPFQGTGVLDITQKLVTEKLSKFQHVSIESTVHRVLIEAEKKTHACNAGWLDTPEWHKLFYFSKPVFVIPANGILMKQSKLKEVQQLEPYSLQKFLDKKAHWKLGVGRLYGEGIDPVLEKNHYKKNNKIITISTSLKVHQMLHSDRIDYTLGYPFEAVYYNELLKSKDKVIYLPLTDNNNFVNVVVACPRDDWGKNIVAEVNTLIQQSPELLTSIRHGVDRWLSEEDRQRLEGPRKAMLKKYWQR
ncbi:TIGR02285 family protein [Bdellovibrio sp. SKB1291214]|uniref:TIGR02285 family protein n=1 Tax=Bdellovibrio sp. SKB1291214 TaxID=1732569 RepID=UPI000B51DF41|nr:TIGR02285 family protein [Bdellovibrio sp. SKB1291214]UYL07395.1 TIGR02285 family protein [Bdellovibrio sp. SKB1291214]